MWISLGSPYLGFVELLGCIDSCFHEIWEIFCHYFFKYFICTFFSPVFLGLPLCACWCAWWCFTGLWGSVHFSPLFLLSVPETGYPQCTCLQDAGSSACSNLLLSPSNVHFISVVTLFNSQMCMSVIPLLEEKNFYRNSLIKKSCVYIFSVWGYIVFILPLVLYISFLLVLWRQNLVKLVVSKTHNVRSNYDNYQNCQHSGASNPFSSFQWQLGRWFLEWWAGFHGYCRPEERGMGTRQVETPQSYCFCQDAALFLE